MPRYSTLDQLQLKVLTKAAGLITATPNQRDVFDQFAMTVTAVADLAPHLRRVTFRAPEFAEFRVTGPDECFGLLMAPPGRPLTMPSADRVNVRTAIRALPAEDQPDLRWYTVRAHRPEPGEIDVDFVLHGDAGPGTRWATRAAVGQSVGFRAGNSGYRPPSTGTVLLVADETALPALCAILETGVPEGTRIFAEVPGEDFRVAVDAPVTWLHRGDDAPGSHVLRAVTDLPSPAPDYAWVCGESTLATSVRRHLVKERGVDRRSVMFSGYWKVGAART
ncbi:NADPH-dependent ferric siderophore reductase [Saccharothrix saharensis]|uniref:NADPH-dependent ferric siderophore reductase n=1 Tax=Saccharothrix saharensis TaxID=571190 RepID=A0A543J8Y4_9PSEU|nr:siderophore-interacting protein [Saccharothrix saharensis]TQM79254.1 NADPH-dependent ferric siderophore reductase [Saccharothrix saharensis]